jgi:hypothetical protein
VGGLTDDNPKLSHCLSANFNYVEISCNTLQEGKGLSFVYVFKYDFSLII